MSLFTFVSNTSGNGYVTIYSPATDANSAFSLPNGSGQLALNETPLISIGNTGITANLEAKGCTLSTNGTITIPSSVFSAGDIFSIYNKTSANVSITQGPGLTLRMSGTANTGSRTLFQYGLATVLFISGNEAVVTGAGVV